MNDEYEVKDGTGVVVPTEHGEFKVGEKLGVGGDLLIYPGRGYNGAPQGKIIFFGDPAGTEEILRLDPDRSLYYRGRKIECDEVLVAGLREWFLRASVG
jgi:hypothetical protein